MSYYDSETQQLNQYDDQKVKQLFRYDTSLLVPFCPQLQRSVEAINDWKQHAGLPTLEYLEKEYASVAKEYEMLSCGSQIRALAFCRALQKGFEELLDKYKKCYARVTQQNYSLVPAIHALDHQMAIMVKYLHLVQANKGTDLFTELDQDGMNQIYINLRAVVDYCVDLNTMWLTLLTPRMFREDLKEHLYRVNYGGTHLYYQRELLYLAERVKRGDINNFILHPKDELQLLKNIATVLNNSKLKPNLKTKVVALLKGQFYADKTHKTLKQQFILSSLQMYSGEELSQIWDYERYENLCIETLRKSFTDKRYLDCALYMEPENILFQRRKRTLEFATIYHTLIYKIINLTPKTQSQQQSNMMKQKKEEEQPQKQIEIPLKYIKHLLTDQNIQLFGHLLVNFLISNKNAFSMNSPKLDKMLFGILEGMRQIYMSFGTQNWYVPTAALAALTNRFFTKFSEEIKDMIFNRLPMMVKHLGDDNLPMKPELIKYEQNGQKHYKCQLRRVSRSQLLMAIFMYIRDAEYRDQDFYLDLPQVTPSNLETAIMFIRSLELKLRHHDPTEDQKQLWTIIIEQSMNEYKIRVNLKWFKPKKRLDVDQRQSEFLIHKQIKEKWAYELMQDALNRRDQEKYDELVNSAVQGELSLEGELINYFKYCVDVKIDASRWSTWIQEYQLFSLLDKMRAILDINFGDIVHLSPDQMVTLNELHLCLMFYNTKFQESKGNEIYMLIVHKIVIPWASSQDKTACQQFQSRFSQFFTNFIIREYYLTIGDSIITLLSNHESNTPNLLYKLNFYLQQLHHSTISETPIDSNAEFLQKVYSILDTQMDSMVMINIMLVILRFIEVQPKLEDEYIGLGFFIDFVCEPAKIGEFMGKIEELGDNQRRKINYEIVKKLPQKFQNMTLTQVCEILKTYIDSQLDLKQPQKLITILDTVPEEKTSLLIVLLKAMIAQRNKQKILETLKNNPEAQKEQEVKCFKYWKKVEQYVQKNQAERKKDEQQINLAKIAQLFQQTAFKKLKEDYKKIQQTENRKKMSSTKKKSSIKSSQSEKADQMLQKQRQKQVQLQDKYKEAKIWRKVVRNFGTFEDIILFGQDPLELMGQQQQQIYQKCLKVIEQRTLQQKYLKRIIRKLPILQKCAQQVISKINAENKQGSKHIQPQLLCKLIMINSRYRSKAVQQFILAHISKIPIPVKIYQDYLVLDAKRKLEHWPKNVINKMLFDELGVDNMRKIDEIFDQLIYLPIKKYENIYLKFEEKIEEGKEQEEGWETESEGEGGDQDEDDGEETGLEKKKSKKKSSKQEKSPQKKQSGKEKEEQGQEDAQQQQKSQPNQSVPRPAQRPNRNRNIQMQVQHEDENEDDQDMDDQDLDDDEDDQDDYNGEQDGEQHGKIVDMFYSENNPNLPKYKQLMVLREEINLGFGNDYRDEGRLENFVKADPELEKKLFKVVDILQNQITQQQITLEILNKLPQTLYSLLKKYGLTKERNDEKVTEYRKQVTKMQKFIKDYMSDRDENSQEGDQQIDQEQIYDEEDQLSEQSNSVDDMFDGMGDQLLFVVNEEGQLEHVNAEDLMKGDEMGSEEEIEEGESQEIKVAENLEKEADDTLSLPQLKQINSKIEAQLTGKELTMDDMVKILQVAIIKLFSLNSYQLKQKPVLSFYSEIIHSRQGKIFIDTLFTVLRVDEMYSQDQRHKLAKRLAKLELSVSKALNNFLEIAVDIITEDSKQAGTFGVMVREQIRSLLPIGDQIMVKCDIPLQDNFLTLLVFYSRYSQTSVHDKIKKLLSNLNDEGKKPYELTKAKTALLTKHIYNNSNSSSIWNNIQQKFGVNIDKKVKFSSCLSVYGQLLREDIEKCYRDLLQIVNVPFEVHNEQQKKQARQLIKQQQKKVEQNLRKHFKRIKHYYYWNKRNINNEIQKNDQNKPVELLKYKSLIKLTQLMIFYCHFLKQRFFEKIDSAAMKNLLVLPKSIIEISFMFLWRLDAKIDKWLPLNKVREYFKGYKLYEFPFNRLEQVCNLVLQFLQMPQFSNSKFKQVIIPYFINNPETAHEIPLIFKLPDIPEQLNGQKVYLTRECSFDMSFYQLTAKSILVEFHNEEGSDHGGMVREFMMGWNGAGVGEEYVFIGKLLAISFRKSIPYGGDFDLAMAVAITQTKVTIEFMETVEPQIAQSLKYVRDQDPSDLQLKFQITKQINGSMKDLPLIPNGQSVAVTNQNKSEYLKLFLQKYYTIGRQWQLSQICTGFFSIVNKQYAAIFSPMEMIQKIQGQQINDYTKLKNKTKYEQGYTETSQMIKWFWEIVSQFNQKQMNKFLQFITGAPKVSIYNHSFSFVIEKPYGEDETRLPVAHTCFNTLELPEYKTKEILEKKLIQAVYEGNNSFGIL